MRFYKYFKRLGYACTVITSTEQEAGAQPDIIVAPDRLAGVWERPRTERLSFGGHLERLVRRVFFPGAIGIMWAVDAAAQIREVVRRSGRDQVVLLTTFPPVGVLLAGLIAGFRERIRWVADFRDPFAAEEIANFYPRCARFWFARLESVVFRRAAAIVANTETAAAWWRNRYPGARSKLHVVWNGFDPEDGLRALAIPPRPFRVWSHTGNLYVGRNANAVIQSLMRLRAGGAPGAQEVRVLQVGGVYHLAKEERALYDNAVREGWLELRPALPKQQALEIGAQSDGLLLLQPQSASQVPAKLYEYLCFGRPILALVPRGSAVEYILERAGVPYECVYSGDPPDAADRALLRFLQLPAEPAPFSDWFEQNFNGRNQAMHVLALLESAGL